MKALILCHPPRMGTVSRRNFGDPALDSVLDADVGAEYGPLSAEEERLWLTGTLWLLLEVLSEEPLRSIRSARTRALFGVVVVDVGTEEVDSAGGYLGGGVPGASMETALLGSWLESAVGIAEGVLAMAELG